MNHLYSEKRKYMKHSKLTALLCALVMTGAGSMSAFAADAAPAAAAATAAQPAKAQETTAAAGTPAEAAQPEVNYTEALLKGMSLTLPDVEKAVEAGTFKNLSPEAPKPAEPEPAPAPEPIPEPEPTPAPEPEPEPEPAPTPAQTAKYTADQGTSAATIETDGTYDAQTYTSTTADQNALRVSYAYMSAAGDTFTKTGDATNTESSNQYGMNAALLVTHGGHGAFTKASITSSALGAPGAFGYSKGTYLNLTDSTVTTTGNNSPALETAEKAMMKVVNTTVSTSGYASPAMKVSQNGGMILAESSHFTTTGKDSHGAYVNGDVTLTNSSVNAQNTKAAVVRNNNTLSLENSTLEGNETGSVPYNIVLYADPSAIGTMGVQQFNATGSTLISHHGGMFLVTGTHNRITLKKTTLQQDPGLPILSALGNDGAYGWGTPGANGGHVELIADEETLNGDIVVDTISDVNLTLRNNSVWTGAITIIPNAQGGEKYKTNADIFIGAGSVWNLTADSQATTVNNLGTINFNGHTITLADGTVLK